MSRAATPKMPFMTMCQRGRRVEFMFIFKMAALCSARSAIAKESVSCPPSDLNHLNCKNIRDSPLGPMSFQIAVANRAMMEKCERKKCALVAPSFDLAGSQLGMRSPFCS